MTLSYLLVSSLLERSANAAQQGAGRDLGGVSTVPAQTPNLQELQFARARATAHQLIYRFEAGEQVQALLLGACRKCSEDIKQLSKMQTQHDADTRLDTFRAHGQSKDAGSGPL